MTSNTCYDSSGVSRDVRIRGTIACLITSFILTYGLCYISTAIPDMERDLGISQSVAMMINYAPIVSTIAWNIIAVILADRYGKKNLMMVGLAILVISNVIPIVAVHSFLVIISRFIMGVGMAFLYVSTVSIMTDLSGSRIHTTSGLYSSLSYFGEMISVSSGLLLAKAYGWRIMVILPLVLSIVAILLMRGVPNTKTGKHEITNMLDHMLFITSMYLILIGIAVINLTVNWYIVLLAGVALLLILIYRQRSPKNRIMNYSLFSNRTFRLATVTAIVFFSMAYTVQQLMNNYITVADAMGLAPVIVMLVNIRIIISCISSPIFSTMSKRCKDTTFPLIGILLSVVSTTSLMFVIIGGDAVIVACAISCIANAFATAIFIGPNMAVMMTNVSDCDRNSASAVNNLIRQYCKMGGTLFMIIFVSVFAESEQATAFAYGFIILGIAFLFITACGIYAIARYRRQESVITQ